MKTMFALILLCLIAFTGGTENYKKRAIAAASHQGILVTSVERDLFSFNCGSDDTISYVVHGYDMNRKPVKAAVCMGLFFKGATVRYL